MVRKFGAQDEISSDSQNSEADQEENNLDNDESCDSDDENEDSQEIEASEQDDDSLSNNQKQYPMIPGFGREISSKKNNTNSLGLFQDHKKSGNLMRSKNQLDSDMLEQSEYQLSSKNDHLLQGSYSKLQEQSLSGGQGADEEQDSYGKSPNTIEYEDLYLNAKNQIKTIRSQVDLRNIEQILSLNKTVYNLENKFIQLDNKKFLANLQQQQEIQLKSIEIKRLLKINKKYRKQFETQQKIAQNLQKEIETLKKTIKDSKEEGRQEGMKMAQTQQSGENYSSFGVSGFRFQNLSEEKNNLTEIVKLKDRIQLLNTELHVLKNQNQGQKQTIENYRHKITGREALNLSKNDGPFKNLDQSKLELISSFDQQTIETEMKNLIQQDQLISFASAAIRCKNEKQQENKDMKSQISTLQTLVKNLKAKNETLETAQRKLLIENQDMKIVNEQYTQLLDSQEITIVDLEENLNNIKSELIQYAEMKQKYMKAMVKINSLQKSHQSLFYTFGLSQTVNLEDPFVKNQFLEEHKQIMDENNYKNDIIVQNLLLFIQQTLGWIVVDMKQLESQFQIIIQPIYGDTTIFNRPLEFTLVDGTFQLNCLINQDSNTTQLMLNETEVQISQCVPFTLSQILITNFYQNNILIE